MCKFTAFSSGVFSSIILSVTVIHKRTSANVHVPGQSKIRQEKVNARWRADRFLTVPEPKAGAILTSGQVGACGWWHKRQVHLWMTLTCFEFPHLGNTHMYPDTSLVKPSEMSSLHLSLGPAEHDSSANVSLDGAGRIWLCRGNRKRIPSTVTFHRNQIC